MSPRPGTAEEALEIFLGRRRGGEAIDPERFAAEHPELEPELSSALRALVALESATGSGGPVPDRIGAYRVVREIGRGGMGVVLEAVEDPLGRRVALKILPPELLASPSARARFRREAELASRLDHSGIATIYGAGVEDERPWIAMRYVEGSTLARAIAGSRAAPGGRAAALRVADLLARVARALHAAHEQGVVHRDIKPSNVIVQPDGSPVLLDFGLAIEPESPSLTRTGEAPGTPAYLAPESVSGELRRPDAQSDVYALGVTLYECLAGRRPFDAPTPAALYHAILAGAPTSLRALDRSVPRDLAVVTSTAMERDRSRRYASALALAEDLEACVAGRPIAARPVPLFGRLARWARREPRLASAIAAVIVVAIAGFLWVSDAKAEAEASARVATKKADDVLSLSAIQELEDLVERADELWPAVPEKVGEYEAWLRDARALIDGHPADPERGSKGRPGLHDHERKLAELEARTLSDGEDRWWHARLTELVANLRAFSAPESGVSSSGISTDHGWGVEKRLEFARTIADRSVDGPEAGAAWDDAIAAIEASPRYAGLELSPQVGLLPIGPDPESGLWEFAHLQTGERAERDANGKVLVTESTGLVFVLIPGGRFWMGAQRTDPTGRNYDPQAQSDESPVHEVELSPYFLSKYEMTQGQWTRFVGRNPSYYGPIANFNGHQHDLRHPVETVTWTDCAEVLGRLGLTLPTEAQWEFGCRAGTSTPWCTGEDRETLRGMVNVADQSFVRSGGPKSTGDDWPDLDDGWAVHAPVDTFPPNPFGLHGVHGDVREWCRDGAGGYDQPWRAGDGERLVPGSPPRIIRGGNFNGDVSTARSAFRFFGTAVNGDNTSGLRPARDITRE